MKLTYLCHLRGQDSLNPLHHEALQFYHFVINHSYTSIPQNRHGSLIIRCAVSCTANPILFDGDKCLFRHQRAVLMVHHFGFPSHATNNFLHLVEDINFIAEYDCPFRPQNTIHLQKDVFKFTLVLIQAEHTISMNEIVTPWISRETFTPERIKQNKFYWISMKSKFHFHHSL